MTTTTKMITDLEAVTAKVFIPTRFPQDNTVNGEPDSETSPQMPLMDKQLTRDGYWAFYGMTIEIDIPTGKIKNWKQGTTAVINAKVVDMGVYTLYNKSGEEIIELKNDYVPKAFELCDEEDRFGDYVFLSILEDGTIEDWNPKNIKNVFTAHSNMVL